MSNRKMNTKFTGQELTRFFICMAVVSFLLHSIWEMSQMPAYKDLASGYQVTSR